MLYSITHNAHWIKFFNLYKNFSSMWHFVVATTSAEIYQSRQMLCTVAIKDEEEKIVAKFIRFQMVFQWIPMWNTLIHGLGMVKRKAHSRPPHKDSIWWYTTILLKVRKDWLAAYTLTYYFNWNTNMSK